MKPPKGPSFATRINLLTVSCALATLAVTLIFLWWTRADLAWQSESLRVGAHHADLARVTQVALKKQVQEWKDILLRGRQPSDLATHWAGFVAQEKFVRANAARLRDADLSLDARESVTRLIEAHEELGRQYRRALEVFAQSNHTDFQAADQLVRGMDRGPTALIDAIVALIGKELEDRRITHAASLARTQRLILLAGAGVFIALLVAGQVIGRQIVLPVRDMAGIVARVSQEKDYSLRAKPGNHDELGVLAAGFNSMLAQIQARDTELQQARDRLEARVRERTEALTETSSLLETMLETSPDAIYFKDRESRFVRVSRALLHRVNLTGYDQMIGKTDFDFFTEEHARPAFEDEQEIIRSGNPIVGKMEKETYPDGRIAWVLTTKLPWRDAGGTCIGTFGISRDSTALKEAEIELAHERDQLRALLDSSPDSIYFKDQESQFVRISRSKAQRMLRCVPGLRERLLGPDSKLRAEDVSTDLFVGLSDADVLSPGDSQTTQSDEQTIMRTGEPIVGKLEKQTFRDGTVYYSITNKMPWRDGDGSVIGTFGISKDVTALKLTEERLEQMHRQLLDTSRQAGMAEIATGVLHNVGNVLNSVNVSATLVAEQVHHSKARSLARLSALLSQHKSDFVQFLTTAPQGRAIPEYIATLAENLTEERQAMLRELDELRKNIEHIKDIVTMQQSYAKSSGFNVTISIPDVVEDALRMNAGSLDRHDVTLVRDYQARPVITLDQHKVMQILINLIRNAKYACDESGRADKQIIVRITADDTHVRITVEDNGVGIAPEHRNRIFAHGFTTRKGGHGFGLHSGALAAKELGGQLSVKSQGLGSGAVFTLELPRKPENPAHEQPDR